MKAKILLFVLLIHLLIFLVVVCVYNNIKIKDLETKLSVELGICTGHKKIADRKFIPTNCYLVVDDE